jgi:hypothetical protein
MEYFRQCAVHGQLEMADIHPLAMEMKRYPTVSVEPRAGRRPLVCARAADPQRLR